MTRVALVALATIVALAACAPHGVSALLQRTACNAHANPPTLDACTHWVNHNTAWNYPAETEWIGPFYDYLFDVSHGNGAEQLP